MILSTSKDRCLSLFINFSVATDRSARCSPLSTLVTPRLSCYDRYRTSSRLPNSKTVVTCSPSSFTNSFWENDRYINAVERSYFTSIIEPNSAIANSVVDERDDHNNNDGSNDNNNIDDRNENSHDRNTTTTLNNANTNHTVIERPCTLILAEEFITIPPLGYITSKESPPSPLGYTSSKESSRSPSTFNRTKKFKSWHPSFSQIFPKKYGISYTKWSITDPDDFDLYNNNSSDNSNSSVDDKLTFDVALTKMKNDFKQISSDIQQPILITRGPSISFMTQFYLESLPLSGLIMIDPLPFSSTSTSNRNTGRKSIDDSSDTKSTSAFELYRNYYNMHCNADENSRDIVLQREYYDIIDDYINHWDHWTLKIEPGSIPMLILSTMVSTSIMKNDISANSDYGNDITSHHKTIVADDDDDDVFNTNTLPSDMNEVENVYLWRDYAEQVASRHRKQTKDRMNGDSNNTNAVAGIQVIDIDPYNISQCSTIIHDWINDKVL
jgi:hypothetical protein